MSTRDVGVGPGEATVLPPVALPRVPSATVVWTRALILAAAALGLFFLDRIALLLMHFWLLESLGLKSVFWTNFRMGAGLFGVAFVALTAAVAAPAYIHRLATTARKRAIFAGILLGLVGGYVYSGLYQEYLLFFNGISFGETDPVFSHDIGFYVFDVPAIADAINLAVIVAALFLASSLLCAWLGRPENWLPQGMKRLSGVVGVAFTTTSMVGLLTVAALLALRTWFERYYVLIRENADSSIANGAEYLDVNGFFSTVNGYTVSALAILFGLTALAVRLRALHNATTGRRTGADWKKLGIVSLVMTLVPGAAIDSAFRAMVALRNETQVTPNEPVIQYKYIERHVDATRAAFGLDNIEEREFLPNGPGAPPPRVGPLMSDPAIQNAPLWPGYVSWLEELIDPEYAQRVLQTGGDTMIYGPTLEIIPQQQKLRPYYNFMDVDTVRYEVDGEDQLFFTSVRELPLVEPQPWLAWWGQRFLLFTHGHGFVAGPVSRKTFIGEPDYTVSDIPMETSAPELAVENPAVYYGEGSGSMGYSNVKEVPEHDFPTEQGRAEIFFPEDVAAGVKIDSLLKRVVFGYKSRAFFDIAFSDLIDSDTRVHYFRTPLERIEQVAPFLYTDTDPYAVAGGDRMYWMLNGMTTTDMYPYSVMAEIGDKSDRRSPTPRPTEFVNYVADSVKATVDAYTGQIKLYKFADEPIVNSWASIYPDLFEEEQEMPAALREQVQYPVQLFHVQFDDLYIYYHMKDPLTFFSLEDAYDDGDEVVGPILAAGDAITFSIEPYYWLARTGGSLPESDEETQFSLSMVFTPEGALNLRAIVTAYMEGDDYGRLSVLKVPKGRFSPGPEQADAAIDQDAFISQQIGLWNRRGLEVIRGHTTPLVVQNEVIYVEPLFIRSKQNPVPQMKRVIVVYRGATAMGGTLAEALRTALQGQTRPVGLRAEPEPAPQEEEEGPPPGKGPPGGRPPQAGGD